jgi:hypothetical protein
MAVSFEHKQRVLQHACDAALKKAEVTIQQILLALEEATGREIDAVHVDTRNFANLRVEIFFEQ